MSRPNDLGNLYGDDRKSQVTGLLSDAHSQYQDDNLSQYMGQSEFGGASQIGANEYQHRAPIEAPSAVMGSTKGSRRAEVAARHGL